MLAQDQIEKLEKDLESEDELDRAIDTSLAVLPLQETEKELVAKIIDAPSKEELDRQFELFNINQSKKNALRIIKLNNLLDKVEDQAIARFTKRPDQVSNKELLEYMTVVSNQIDRAQSNINTLSEKPGIRVTNQKNEVNINVGPALDKDDKEQVVDAITALLKQVRNGGVINVEPEEVIDVNPENVENPEENNVYLNDDVLSEEKE